MILRSLKNLRTTRRSRFQTNNTDPQDQLAGCAVWNKLVGFGTVFGLSIACWLASPINQTHAQDYQSQAYGNQASRIQTTTASETNSAALSKQKYEAALRAQMIRAQREQGASPEFAEQAFQATKAYLEETAEKSYRTGESSSTAKAASYQPTASQTRSVRIPNRSAYTQATYSQPVSPPAGRANYQKRSAMPPVHVAPGPQSTPPAAQRMYRTPSSAAARQPQASPRLQDRLASLVRRKKQPVPEARQASHSEPTLAAPQSTNQEPATNRFSSDAVVAEELAKSDQQPLFVPEPRRLPKNNRMANSFVAERTAAAERSELANQQAFAMSNEPSEVRHVALNRPSVAPKQPTLRGPAPTGAGNRPQDYFDTVQVKRENKSIAAPTQVPTKLASSSPTALPSMQGAQGRYQVPGRKLPANTVSVLTGKSEALPPRSTSAPATSGGFSNAKYSRPVAQPAYDGGRFGARGPALQEANQEPTSPSSDPNAFGGAPAANEAAPQQNDPRIRSLNPLRDEQNQGATQEVESSFDRQLREMEERRRQEGDVDDDVDKLLDGMGDDEGRPEQAPQKTCQDYRTQLLGSSIRDIALDMSPPASRIRDQFVAISRSWTDRLGNVVATGTMVDLRRGYVIIEEDAGRLNIPYAKQIDADLAAVSEYWQIPELCSVGGSVAPTRAWVPQTTTWHASALCHKPLYFENRQLERYGHTHGPVLQPLHSTAHFFVSLATLPYQTAIHPPTECMYALGFYRPGNCAPWLKDPVPISLDGIRRQAMVTTALGVIP